MSSYYKPGCWNVICDACGFKRKSDEVRKRWDGFIVCSDTCWEPRHPQDFIRSRPDNSNVPFVRLEPTDTFVWVAADCVADTAQADFAVVA